MASRAHEQALAAMLSHLALSFDGAIIGAALAYAAVRSFLSFTANSKSLAKIRKAPSLSVSDLRSVLQNHDQDSQNQEQKLVIVRGQVEAKSAVDGSGKKSLGDCNVLLSHESGDKAVILQRTQTCIYNEWKGFFGWTSDLRSIFGRSLKEQETTFLRTVGVLHEEKILPLGKCISAVGICNSEDGIPEIKSCKDLPYFLADMTKDQMVADLAIKVRILLWSGIVLGSLSIGVLGFAVMRNWNKWKAWRQRRSRSQPPIHTSIDADVSQNDDNEEAGDVPEGQLCVICLMRRKRSAFIPCGHLACCHTCAISVEREVSPKCPLCRQAVRNSIRIFDC